MSSEQQCQDCVDVASASTVQTTSEHRPETASSTMPPTHDPLDPSTFLPPLFDPASTSLREEDYPRAVIEYCDRCRWLHRATWTSTELFLTFPPPTPPIPDDPGAPSTSASPSVGLRSVSLIPLNRPETGGRFRVWVYRIVSGQAKADLAWDRKVEGKFPEMKELKQRVRDLISPGKGLGHSDKEVKRT